MPGRAYTVLWWLSTLGSLAGFVAALAGAPWGVFLAVVAATVLADLAWTKYPGATGIRGLPPRVWVAGLGGGMLAVLGALPTRMGLDLRAALIVTGFQLLVAAAGEPATRPRSPGRPLVAVLGHATMLLGTALRLGGGDAAALATCWGAGGAVVLLHAFWTQRERGGPGNEWEAVFLASLVSGLLVPVAYGVFDLDAARGLALMAGVGIVALAVLGRPPMAPGPTELDPGAPAATLAHGLAALALVNGVLFAYSLVSRWAVEAVLFVVFSWVFITTTLEYRAILHARRRRRNATPPPEADVPPGAVTVLVAAQHEGHLLEETLEHNLALDVPLRFVIVAADASPETIDAARAVAARHPDRVEVLVADAGSKAADLNLAWPTVPSEFILVLDADETIDEAFVRRGHARMLADPTLGIVQGRKVARDPDSTALARFVTAERRFSTWMDQPLQDEDGAAHFAGSGALMRWSLLFDLEGWRAGRLTEDIDLTLRVKLDTSWRIAYEPAMVVREATPATTLSLLRQRTRWARGWAEVTGMYLREVLKARRKLGPVPQASLAWQLITSVSAPWATLLPLLVLVRSAGVHPLLPPAVALVLAVIILPSRYLAYAYAARHDPVTPLRGPRRRRVELALHAYAWILLGWAVQLHALYLELADAPRPWHVTTKTHGAAAKRPVG